MYDIEKISQLLKKENKVTQTGSYSDSLCIPMTFGDLKKL